MLKKRLSTFKTQLIAIVILAVVILILLIVTDHPLFIERFYSENLYRFICHILHPVFNIFPFSVGDVFYILLIIYCLWALVKLFRLAFKKRFRDLLVLLFKLIIITQSLFLVFYLFWGLNYFRPPAAERLALQDTAYTLKDIEAVTTMMVDSVNASRAVLSNADFAQSNQQIYQQAEVAVTATSIVSRDGAAIHPGIKSSILSFALNYLETSGYYNPFTSEAQINYQMPVFLKPFVACHEMSHQMGYGAEDEADFAGFVAAVSAHDKLLKYSAYYIGTEEFMHAISRRDSVTYKQLKAKISKPVMADFKNDRLYWKSFEGKAGTLSGIFYDHFLKANNQPHGLQTYSRMVRLVMAWYRKKQPK